MFPIRSPHLSYTFPTVAYHTSNPIQSNPSPSSYPTFSPAPVFSLFTHTWMRIRTQNVRVYACKYRMRQRKLLCASHWNPDERYLSLSLCLLWVFLMKFIFLVFLLDFHFWINSDCGWLLLLSDARLILGLKISLFIVRLWLTLIIVVFSAKLDLFFN